jgi:hypothetical protein
MSSIDRYNHIILGYISCPSSFDFVFQNNTREIPIYQVLENIPSDENDFEGKKGDILVGGGSGEAAAFRISNPLAFHFFISDEDTFFNLKFNALEDVFKSFWTANDAFVFGEGYQKLGWTPEVNIDLWLAENVCFLLINNLFEFEKYKRKDMCSKLQFRLP